MKIKFIKKEDLGQGAKMTVHQSGKFGFSSECVEYLSLTEGKAIHIGVNEEDENDPNLYAMIVDKSDEGAHKISKAGDYYYVNAKQLLDKLEIDYKTKRIIYDLVKIQYEGNEIIKMTKREIIKKNKTMQATE